MYFICFIIVSPKTPNETLFTLNACSLNNVLHITIAKASVLYFEDVLLGFKCHNPDKAKSCRSRKSRIKSLGLFSLLEKTAGGKDTPGEMAKTRLES